MDQNQTTEQQPIDQQADPTASAGNPMSSAATGEQPTDHAFPGTTDTRTVEEVQAFVAEQRAGSDPVAADPAPFVIAPTVGRKVHFYPNGANFHSNPYCISPDEPMDADVVYVWSERMVNLCVRDHIGQVHAFTSITLRQPDDAKPQGAYAEWMPFQAAQARAAA